MKKFFRFKGLQVFTCLIVCIGGFAACSSNSPARKQTMSEMRESGRDIDDLRRWFVLSDIRRSTYGKASFVLSADKLKAYVLFKESVLSSMGIDKCDMDQKYYSCPRNSKYCSMCINLKDLTLSCGSNRDDSYDSGGAIVADNQSVSVRKITLVDENKSVAKLIFSGMPAKFIFNTSSNTNETKIDEVEHYKFSNNTDLDPEVVCKQNLDTVTCNATLALASL